MTYNGTSTRKKGKVKKKKREEKSKRSNLREVSIRYDEQNQNHVVIDKSLQSTWPNLVEYVGLSEYESKIYLGLVKLGTSGARKLSLNCDVPRTKVYGTLKKLIDYGLVIEIPGSPKKFIASDPRTAFSTLLELQRMQAVDFAQLMEEMGTNYEKSIEHREPEIISSWLYTNGPLIMEKCIEFIRNTSKVLTITTDANGLEAVFNKAGSELDNLNPQETTVKIYSPLDPKTNSLARELNYVHDVFQIEVQSNVFLLNSDNSKYILAKTLPRNDDQIFELAIFGESPEIVHLLDLISSISGNGSIREPIMSI